MTIAISVLDRIHNNDATLQSLDLSNNNINDQDIESLVNALHSNTFLRTLNLRNNRITARGAKLLAGVTTLRTLYLYNGNSIGEEGLNAFLNNTSLTSFPIQGGSGSAISRVRTHINSNTNRINQAPQQPITQTVVTTTPQLPVITPQQPLNPLPTQQTQINMTTTTQMQQQAQHQTITQNPLPTRVIQNANATQTNVTTNSNLQPDSILSFHHFCVTHQTKITFPANTASKHNYIKRSFGITPVTPITISYRDEGNGNGSFYDHYTLQKSTRHSTECSLPPTMNTSDLNTAIRQSPHTLTFGVPQPTNLGRNTPAISTEQIIDMGLLVIPGRARETEKKRVNIHQTRTQHEQLLLQQAINIGRPVLALCAGSWQLWEAFGGQLITVEDHNHGSAMPRIGTSGDIVNNGQVHRISITPTTIIAGAMQHNSQVGNVNERLPQVNSVHWMAPDDTNTPAALDVTVRCQQDNTVAPNNRHARQMQPDPNTVEGFETKSGAPQLGIQWHPEAYNSNDATFLQPQKHRKLLQYMAKAGDTFHAKQQMLNELKQKYSQAQLLGAQGIFTDNQLTIRPTTTVDQTDQQQIMQTNPRIKL